MPDAYKQPKDMKAKQMLIQHVPLHNHCSCGRWACDTAAGDHGENNDGRNALKKVAANSLRRAHTCTCMAPCFQEPCGGHLRQHDCTRGSQCEKKPACGSRCHALMQYCDSCATHPASGARPSAKPVSRAGAGRPHDAVACLSTSPAGPDGQRVWPGAIPRACVFQLTGHCCRPQTHNF